MDGITNVLEKLNFFGVEADAAAAFGLAVVGVIGVLLAFGIALILKFNSQTSKLKERLEDVSARLNTAGIIDQENIGAANNGINALGLPRSAGEGWGRFLEQQTGYPSDYITEKDFLADPDANPKTNKGKTVFGLISAIFILLCAGLAAFITLGKIDLSETAVNPAFAVVASAVGALCGPLLVFFILLTVLNARYNADLKKRTAAFNVLQDILDTNVLIFREEPDEFVSENIEEINATIEEILANKLDDKEIIHIVTTPGTEEYVFSPEDFADDLPYETAQAEVAAEDAPQSEEDQKYAYLLNLVKATAGLLEYAGTTKDDVKELVYMIEMAKNSGVFDDPEPQDIFDICLSMLAEAAENAY